MSSIRFQTFSVLAFIFAVIVTAQSPDPSTVRPRLTIIEALFGLGNTWADYTEEIAQRVTDDYLYLHVNLVWQEIGDPLPGADKYLKLYYQLGDQTFNQEKIEGDVFMINLPPPDSACREQLIEAQWGSGSDVIDVTEKMRDHIIGCSLDFEMFASPRLFGDPAPGSNKQMLLRYRLPDGTIKSETFNEEGFNSRARISFTPADNQTSIGLSVKAPVPVKTRQVPGEWFSPSGKKVNVPMGLKPAVSRDGRILMRER